MRGDPIDLRTLFDRAVSLAPGDRAAFLDHACQGNSVLREQLERLLASHDQLGSVLDTEHGFDTEHEPDNSVNANTTVAKDRPPLTPGARLGPYAITGLLGAGGMGEVYKARDIRLDRNVAIKVLPPGVASDPAARQRLEREARAAAALAHPHICTLLDIGRQDDVDYLVMEYLDGETLATRLARDRLPLEDALTYAIQIAEALDTAHQAGIVHRDLKPGNVMLTKAGAKLLDFGLAKRQPRLVTGELTAVQSQPVTRAGVILGTVQYMAPEQLEGKPADARTDIFAFGALLYEMLTGRRAFEGASDASLIGNILHADPPALSSIARTAPTQLEDLVRRCLAKEPGARPGSIAEVRALLRDVRDNAQMHGRGIPGRWRSLRAPGRLALAAVVVLLVSLATVFAWRWLPRPTTQAPQAERAPAQRNLTRLTFDEGLQTEPTFSPDGRFIAYASDRAGNFDIWVQQISGGDPVQVTKSPAHDTEPSWSPDGSLIAFRSERDASGIYVVPALGGRERRLSGRGVHPSWSPDGNEVRFIKPALPVYDHAGGLFAVSLGGDTPRKILPEFTAMGDWSWIGGHPDGRVSFLGVHRKLGFGFFTVSEQGDVTDSGVLEDIPGDYQGVSTAAQLLFEMRWNRRQRFHWNREGTRLMLQASMNGNLWQVRVDPATLRWTSMERITTGASYDVAPAFSPDGTNAAFSSQRKSARLWRFEFDRRRRRISSGRPLTEEAGVYVGFDISPDGRTAAYCLCVQGQPDCRIWVRPVDSGHPELVNEGGWGPVWSRDGRRVAYVTPRGDFSGEKHSRQPVIAIAVREPGATEERVTPWLSNTWMDLSDWLPDGRGLLLRSPPNLVIWPLRSPAATSPSRTLVTTNSSGSEHSRGARDQFGQGKLSPDGRWLVFITQQGRPDVSEIRVTALEAAPNHPSLRIAPGYDWVEQPRWAPDGTTLYFLSMSSGQFLNVWGVAFDPNAGKPIGEPFQVTRYDSPAMWIGSGGLNVFERNLFLEVQTASGNIWTLDNLDR